MPRFLKNGRAIEPLENTIIAKWSNFCQVLNRIIQLIEISKGASPDDIWAQDEEL